MRRRAPTTWLGYEQFFFTLTGRACQRCGRRPEFIDTPGLCVECAARERLAERLEPKYAALAAKAAEEGRKAGASKGGKTAGRGRPIASGPKKTKGKRAPKAKQQAAKSTGLSASTLAKVDEIKREAEIRAAS